MGPCTDVTEGHGEFSADNPPVFSCYMLEDREAIERALHQLGLLHLAKRYWRCFRNSTSNDGAQVLPLSLDSTAYSRTASC